MASVEHTLSQLNGYHEHILEALKIAADHCDASGTPSTSGNPIDDEALTEPMAELLTEPLPEYSTDSYRKNIMKHIDSQADEEYEEYQPCAPVRIRNLRDLIKQLEHTTRNRSPTGSEDMRMSESEADRPYRKDSSVCSESSQG